MFFLLFKVFSSLCALDSLKGSQRRWGRQGTLGSTMSTARSRAMSRTLTTWRVWRLKRKSTRSDGCHSRMQHISSSPPMVRTWWHQEISNSQLGWSTTSRPVYSLYCEISTVNMHEFLIDITKWHEWPWITNFSTTYLQFPALCQPSFIFSYLGGIL